MTDGHVGSPLDAQASTNTAIGSGSSGGVSGKVALDVGGGGAPVSGSGVAGNGREAGSIAASDDNFQIM